MADDPQLEDVREWYIIGRRVHDPFNSDANLVERFDRWLAEHDREVARKAEDQFRRLLWIIADRHIGGVLISDAELTAAPNLPGITVEYDRAHGLTTVRAVSDDRGVADA